MYKIIGADQKEYGPSTADEIRQWVAQGRANGRTLVQLEGSKEWKPLASFAEFAGLNYPVPTPPLAGPVPPLAPVMAPPNYPASVLFSNRQLSIGDCMNRGWHLLMNNFGLLFPATVMVCGLKLFLSLLPFVGLLAALFTGVFYGGLYMVFLKRIRNQPVSVGDAFSGFGENFTQLLLVGVISLLLNIVGLCACLLPAIFLFVAWIFAIPLVADKRLGFWDAMELSRKVVTRQWFRVAILLLLCYLPVIVFAIYSNIVGGQYISSLVQSHQLDFGLFLSDPSKFVAQFDQASRGLAEKFGYLILFQAMLLIVVQPFAKAVLSQAYEVLFNPGPTPPA